LFSDNPSFGARRPAPWTRLARGIEAGILGGGAMLALMILASLLRNRVWFEVPNVLGSTFYGSRAFHSGLGMATLAGTALHFVIAGSIGAIFGLLSTPIRQRKRLILFGIFLAMAWYYLGRAVFWTRVNPWVPAYSPAAVAAIAHAVYGLCLGFSSVPPEQQAKASLTPLTVETSERAIGEV